MHPNLDYLNKLWGFIMSIDLEIAIEHTDFIVLDKPCSKGFEELMKHIFFFSQTALCDSQYHQYPSIPARYGHC